MGSYTINYPDDLWEKFKKIVNKTQTMNDKIIELIKKEVEKEEEVG